MNRRIKMSDSQAILDALMDDCIKHAKIDVDKMVNERDRLATFATWPKNNPVQGEDLAKAAFFFPGLFDIVRCFSCQGQLMDFEEDDTAIGEHIKHFPECPFLNGTDKRNVPLLSKAQKNRRRRMKRGKRRHESPVGDSTDCPEDVGHEAAPKTSSLDDHTFQNGVHSSSSEYGADDPFQEGLFDPLNCRHKKYAKESVRVASMDAWPSKRHTLAPRRLYARAGFFYEGRGDELRCFYCDGGVENWEAVDDPWMDHARWFPGCKWLIEQRGQDFVDDVRAKYGLQSPAPAPAAANSVFRGCLKHSATQPAASEISRSEEQSIVMPQRTPHVEEEKVDDVDEEMTLAMPQRTPRVVDEKADDINEEITTALRRHADPPTLEGEAGLHLHSPSGHTGELSNSPSLMMTGKSESSSHVKNDEFLHPAIEMGFDALDTKRFVETTTREFSSLEEFVNAILDTQSTSELPPHPPSPHPPPLTSNLNNQPPHHYTTMDLISPPPPPPSPPPLLPPPRLHMNTRLITSSPLPPPPSPPPPPPYAFGLPFPPPPHNCSSSPTRTTSESHYPSPATPQSKMGNPVNSDHASPPMMEENQSSGIVELQARLLAKLGIEDEEEDDVIASPSRSESPPSTQHSTDISASVTSDPEEESWESHTQLCKICLERELETLFLPCRHLVTCSTCASRLKVCPMCRKKIMKKLDIFMS